MTAATFTKAMASTAVVIAAPPPVPANPVAPPILADTRVTAISTSQTRKKRSRKRPPITSLHQVEQGEDDDPQHIHHMPEAATTLDQGKAFRLRDGAPRHEGQ